MTYRDLGNDSLRGCKIGTARSLWANVPLEGKRGPHLSLRLQRQTVVGGARNRHVLILNYLNLVAAAHHNSVSFVAPEIYWRNLFQNLCDRLRRHKRNVIFLIN